VGSSVAVSILEAVVTRTKDKHKLRKRREQWEREVREK
jgi:hypothetical protein